MVDAMSGSENCQTGPTITVAMPIYNAGKYLRLAVLSIMRQTEVDWELLIIDDGSTDNALATISDVIDPRIRLLQDGRNKGLAQRLNEAIDLARGKYFARMDQDDVSYPERLARQLKALQDNPMLDLVATRAITIDENGRATGMFSHALAHEKICARPWRGFYFPHPTWMGKIEWFRKYRYAIPGPYLCEDQELLLRSYRDSKFGTVDEILFAYRVRHKVDQKKLARTRRTILAAQLCSFSKSHMWHFVLLAIVAYIGKVILDLMKRLGEEGVYPDRAITDNEILKNWHSVLDALAEGSGAK